MLCLDDPCLLYFLCEVEGEIRRGCQFWGGLFAFFKISKAKMYCL